jgi:hypothetical protein
MGEGDRFSGEPTPHLAGFQVMQVMLDGPATAAKTFAGQQWRCGGSGGFLV